MTFSLQARVVFPVDRPPIEHGVVAIDGERIIAVGDKAEHGNVTDLGLVALLPGQVNAHTHLEFSYLLQPLGRPGMPLVDWIRLVIAERGRRNYSPDPLRGVVESRAAGVTTLGDISTSAQSLYDATVFDTVHFHEVIGFSQARAESAMTSLLERVVSEPTANNRCIRQGYSPHAPYTVSPALLKDLILIARSSKWPVAMHLAESREELSFLRYGTGPFQELLEERGMWDPTVILLGSRPLHYLQMLSEAPRTLVIHGNFLDDQELNFIATNRERMSLVYCPRTHAYFEHPPYPLGRALSLGVRVALGTDSRASNPDLSLLSEMRHVARVHPAVNPHEVLRMGTLAGAESLGRACDVGSISPSKHANLVAIPLTSGIGGDPTELLLSLLHSNAAPSSIWLRGANPPSRAF